MPEDLFKIRIEIELKMQAFPPLSTLFNETKNTQKKIDFIFIFSFLTSAAFFFNASHLNLDNCLSTDTCEHKCAYQSQCYLQF